MRWLIALMALGVAACGGAPEPKPEPPKEEVKAEPAKPAVDRSKLPEPGPLEAWTPPAVNTWTMENGITVWHVEQRQAPLLSLRVVLPNGAATDPESKAGLTALMVDLLDEGAGKLDALQLGEAFQRLATDYGTSVATDGVLFYLDMLADKLDPSLALLMDILRKPKMDKKEFDRRKDLWLAQALASEADIGTATAITMRKVLHGGGYGGWPTGGTRDTLKKVTYKDVMAQYRGLIQPKGATIIAVGAIDQAALKTALQKHFGEWQGEPTVRTAKPNSADYKRAIYWIDFPGSTQSSISVGRRIPGTNTPDYFRALVFNHALGGAFTSRYNMNLREDKGYTYGAGSGFNRWRQAGMLTLGAKVKSDTTAPSLDETFKELAAIKDTKRLTAEEHAEALGSKLLGFPGRFERMSSVAGQLAQSALDGHPADWLLKWPAKVKAVKQEEAAKMADIYAVKDPFVIVVAGDRKALEASVKHLEMPIIACNAQGVCDRK